MRIFVNDESREAPEGCSLAAALSTVGVQDARGWAVAVNEEVVPTESWETLELETDDSVLLVQATQGG